jgi:hypothetical protein
MHLSLVLTVLLASGCTSALPEGVIALPEGKPFLPGPMPKVGPFKTYFDALMDACPRMLSLPNAVADRPESFNYRLYWDTSTEYCAWIYYTPTGLYELSWIGTNESQKDPRRRSCDLPPYVSDPRYPDDQIRYVFAIHSHPVPTELSKGDLRYIIEAGRKHGLVFNNKDGQINLGIIAFFTKGNRNNIRCDGFFQYFPFTGELLKWTPNEQAGWKAEKQGTAQYKWNNGGLEINEDKIKPE